MLIYLSVILITLIFVSSYFAYSIGKNRIAINNQPKKHISPSDYESGIYLTPPRRPKIDVPPLLKRPKNPVARTLTKRSQKVRFEA